MIIEIKDFSKKIKNNVVLDNINLSLKSGKIYGLKGINGSGKTMLMRAIAGLIYATNGEVIIDGEILGKDIHFPKSVGILIENPAFLKQYTGLDNLKIIAGIKDIISEELIRKALLKVGLNPDDKRIYSKYSLGMKQRLGIAAAIMENPDLLILDEPLNALDEKAVEMVHSILDEFKAQDKLVIIACHDKEELLALSDEIIEIEDGKIVKDNKN